MWFSGLDSTTPSTSTLGILTSLIRGRSAQERHVYGEEFEEEVLLPFELQDLYQVLFRYVVDLASLEARIHESTDTDLREESRQAAGDLAEEQ